MRVYAPLLSASTHPLTGEQGWLELFERWVPPATVQGAQAPLTRAGVCSTCSVQGTAGHRAHRDPAPREYKAPLWPQLYQTPSSF